LKNDFVSLISNFEIGDDAKKRYDDEYKLLRFRYALTMGWISGTLNQPLLPTGKSYVEVKSAAETSYNEKTEGEKGKKDPKGFFKYLHEDDKDAVVKYYKFMSSGVLPDYILEVMENKRPETMSGVYRDIRQRAHPLLKGATRDQVKDRLLTSILPAKGEPTTSDCPKDNEKKFSSLNEAFAHAMEKKRSLDAEKRPNPKTGGGGASSTASGSNSNIK
jgi:hypothetical protein